MSTLAVVEAILREAAMPLSVREIVERAGDALPTKSKTPDTVVARDLSMDIKKKSDGSTFVRTSPGRYAIREMALAPDAGTAAESTAVSSTATAPATPALPIAATLPAPPPSLNDAAGATTPLVGQTLQHDRSGVRAVPAKPQTNSEDTPMSA